jgi:hypothetical protein
MFLKVNLIATKMPRKRIAVIDVGTRVAMIDAKDVELELDDFCITSKHY